MRSGTLPSLQLTLPGDAMSVRFALKSVMGFLRDLTLPEGRSGAIELVLAEVLNNITEHAYGETMCGVIELRIFRMQNRLHFVVLDDGLPMPEDAPNPNIQLEPARAPSTLPEGGFGWMLISELTNGLSYARTGNRNVLEFDITIDQTVQPH